MIFIGYTASLAYGILCLLLSVFAYNLGMKKRYTRKIVHILVGFEWVILYHCFGVGWNFLAVCLMFTALLAFSYRKNLFVMISSDSDNAPGTVYYGLSMTVMAIASMIFEGFVFAFGIAVFCTSIGDGLAGVIGALFKRFNFRIYKNKTAIGTVSAFVFSLASTLVFSGVYSLGLSVGQALLISAFASGVELVSDRGLDNITLPLGTSILSYLIMTWSGITEYIVPIILTPFIIAFASSMKILTKKGIFVAVVLDLAVTVSLGNFGFVLLLSFLLLSVAIDKIKKSAKKRRDEVTKKSGARDSVQVVANGVIPAIFAILFLFTNNYVFVVGYVTALAECFADTAGSGFGALSKRAFDVFKMKSVEVGISGGMSPLGTVSSLLSATLISAIALPFGIIDYKVCIICAVCGFVGSVFDSALGSIAQAKYKCVKCSAITEKEHHCECETILISGIKQIDNDAVNFISCAFASLISMLVFCIV